MRRIPNTKKVDKSSFKILDWYVHQGHQYEFSKLNHKMYLVGVDGEPPDWNRNHRPLRDNVIPISELEARRMKFDVVIIRSPISRKRYLPYINSGAVPISVVQTTDCFDLPPECRFVVWNSLDVMNKFKDKYRNKEHNYIVHGYDPNEFKPISIEKNGKVLTVANVFKGRSHIMGYPLWEHVNRKLKNLEVVGHGNLDIYKRSKEASTFEELIEIYNRYSVYFNTTLHSAMPRSRAEAAMCGAPIVTTNNYDIGRYFKNNESAILTNNKDEIIAGIKKLLSSKQMREDYGGKAREVAIKHFHINDFLSKWNSVLERV